jgi:DNA modification methylase
MTLPIDQIICGDNCDVLGTFPRECIDLVVTSPPYDDLRTYGGHTWDFYGVAWQLKRVLKPGGVIVWVVNDASKDNSETGSSFRQALHFKEIGLNLHDTMIYHRQAANPPSNRYWQNTEYMFVFSNGAPATVNLLKDRKNTYRKMGGDNVREKDGSITKGSRSGIEFGEFGFRENLWRYSVGGGLVGDAICHQHPAPFPEGLARDHILSWSNEGDIVLDPFNGSGTTTKMARECGRRFIGIDVNAEYCEIAQKRLKQQLLPLCG